MIPRYQTEAIAKLWSDEARFARWTDVEIAVCEAWHTRGEIPDDEMQAIRQRAHAPTPERVREIERETNHDVVAFVRGLSESIGQPAARHIHRGLTSSDVIDTALALTLRDSLDVVIDAAIALRDAIGRRALEFKRTPCAGRTHGIHAEPTTFGVRLAGWYTEMGRNLDRLQTARESVCHAKLSGAVGTFSQTDPELEAFVVQRLELAVEPVATQVVPRDRHAEVLTTLALLGAGLERFAFEIRALQRTDLREAEEPFREGQTGSSAMPHKRNPILSERITGMARLLRGYMVAAVEDVALWHDRDISHSSVERVMFPDAFHLAHYMLTKMRGLIDDLRVYPDAMQANLEKTRGLLFSQSVLGRLLEAGLDRQEAYAIVQSNAMRVWEGQAGDFRSALAADAAVRQALGDRTDATLDAAFDLERYLKHVDALFARAGLGG